jgi:ribosomal protein S6--L-glutamate ligase
MNIAIISINDFRFHPNMRLQQAARACGHEVFLINPHEMAGMVKNNSFDFTIKGTIPEPDIILPRQGSPMGEYGFVLLRQFMHLGIPLVNNIEGITIARNQFISLQKLCAAGIPVPGSCFIVNRDMLSWAVESVGGYPVVIKQVDGMGGDGVIKADRADDACEFLKNNLPAGKGLVVQQFIDPSDRIDLRFFVIGDRVAGAMKLEPCSENFKTNIHQNGRAVSINPDKTLEKIALQAAKACCLEIAGVDMIMDSAGRPQVLEVNYSPGFRGLESVSGIDIAEKIIKYLDRTWLRPEKNWTGNEKRIRNENIRF